MCDHVSCNYVYVSWCAKGHSIMNVYVSWCAKVHSIINVYVSWCAGGPN